MNPVNEKGDDLLNMLAPLFSAQPSARMDTNVILERSATLVMDLRKFSRFGNAIDNQGCPEASPQSKEEQVPALITAQRLHGGIIHDLHWHAKSAAKIEPYPA